MYLYVKGLEETDGIHRTILLNFTANRKMSDMLYWCSPKIS